MLITRPIRPFRLPLRECALLALAILAGLLAPAGPLGIDTGSSPAPAVAEIAPEPAVPARVLVSEPAPAAFVLGLACFGAMFWVRQKRCKK